MPGGQSVPWKWRILAHAQRQKWIWLVFTFVSYLLIIVTQCVWQIYWQALLSFYLFISLIIVIRFRDHSASVWRGRVTGLLGCWGAATYSCGPFRKITSKIQQYLLLLFAHPPQITLSVQNSTRDGEDRDILFILFIFYFICLTILLLLKKGINAFV